MPLDIAKFFNLPRLLDLRPAIALNTVYFLLAVFAVLIIIATIIKIIKKTNKGDGFRQKLLEKYSVALFWLGVFGLILTWFRYERVNILSARFWLLVWFVGLIVWLAFVLKYQFKTVPAARQQLQKTQEFKKYLPKKK